MTRFKIVFTDTNSPNTDLEEAELQASGLDYDLLKLNYLTAHDLIPHVEDADALIVNGARIDRTLIQTLKHCKVISRYGIGVDVIDLKAASECGIPVANVPDFCIEEVSSHTLTFLLMLNRHLLTQHMHVKAGKWAGAPGGLPTRLSEQVLGIVGLGNIGKAVAHRAKGFGLQILAYDPLLSAEQMAELGVEKAEWKDLLRRADYVSLHCPLNDHTRHLVNGQAFALMKPSAYLINVARGPIVDQAALYQALVDHRIAGAALDVLEKEPPSPLEPLLQLDNVLFTPHTSGTSGTSAAQLRREVAQNVIAALRGERPRSVVNRKELGWAN